MAITSNEITAFTHAAFLPDIWADDTQDAIEFKEVLSKLVDTQYEDEMAIGRVLHIPHRNNLFTQTKTEGVSNQISFNAITQTNQSVTIATYQYAAVLLNAVVQAQSKYNDRKKLSDKMGYALVRGIEVNIANQFANGSPAFPASTGVYGADTDDAIVRRTWQFLADGGFYEDANWVFSPGAAQSLFGQDRFVSRDFQGDYAMGKSAIQTAELPQLYSFPSFVSNLLNSPATGQHDNALFWRPFLILIRQVKPTPKTQYRIEWNADAMLIYDLYAVQVTQQPAEAPTNAGGSTGGANPPGGTSNTNAELESLISASTGYSPGVLIKGL